MTTFRFLLSCVHHRSIQFVAWLTSIICKASILDISLFACSNHVQANSKIIKCAPRTVCGCFLELPMKMHRQCSAGAIKEVSNATAQKTKHQERNLKQDVRTATKQDQQNARLELVLIAEGFTHKRQSQQSSFVTPSTSEIAHWRMQKNGSSILACHCRRVWHLPRRLDASSAQNMYLNRTHFHSDHCSTRARYLDLFLKVRC